MPWAVLIAAAALTAVGVMVGWPWGIAVVAGCVLLPLAVTRLLLRLFPPRVWEAPGLSRKPLHVVAVRLTPERQALPVTVTQLPGASRPPVTTRGQHDNHDR